MEKLSIILLTHNEEENIERCLHSVKTLSEDIVLIDSGSTDATLKLAKAYNVRVFKKNLVDFASQRNFANSKTKYSWVLSLDADEEIPEDLRNEIKNTLHDSSDVDAYLIPRRNIIFGKEIKHTRWSPDKHVWLYKKGKGRWVGKLHEEFTTSGSIGELSHGKLHHSHKSVKDFLDMLNAYTSTEAKRIHESGEKFSFYKLAYFSARSFVGRFLVKKGYLDGLHGFVLSVLMSFYRFVTWIKVWELEIHD